MDITTIGSQQFSQAPAVNAPAAPKTESESVTTTAFGDTVEISDEARALSVTSMDEADTGASSTEKERSHAVVAEAEKGGQSNDSGNDTSDIEAEISALRSEINALSSLALTDESAKAELSEKQAELATLISELSQAELGGTS